MFVNLLASGTIVGTPSTMVLASIPFIPPSNLGGGCKVDAGIGGTWQTNDGGVDDLIRFLRYNGGNWGAGLYKVIATNLNVII